MLRRLVLSNPLSVPERGGYILNIVSQSVVHH